VSTKNTQPAEHADDLTYEQSLERVERIADQIESGEVGIEEALTRYEHAMKLIKHCRGILDRAEQKITELTAADAPDRGPDNA